VGAVALAALVFALLAAAPLPQPQNPVYAGDFPDPFVVRARDGYHAFATRGESDIQHLFSRDLATWEPRPGVLPVLPPWAAPGRTWAPAVLEREGRWVLYFSARNAASGRQCIGTALAADPGGPFAPRPEPLVCADDAALGAIDPSPFVDRDGAPYLLWAACCTQGELRGQRLSKDGLSTEGIPQALIRADLPWEDGLVEGPSMLREGERFYLFYSANHWQGARYAVGVAECASPLGPCAKPRREPFLSSEKDMAGPGGQEFFRDGWGRVWITYHAWSAERPSYQAGGARSLRVERVELRDGSPDLAGRTASADRTRPDSGGASPADPGRTPR
jgi:beta-xylosidase